MPSRPLTVMLAACALAASAASRAADAPGPLFPVLKDGKWGYIDRAGRLAIPAKFDEAQRYREGLASVRLGRRLGFIDAAGQVVLEPAFQPDGAIHRRFSEGLAAVRQGGRIGFIDRAGKLAIPARYLSAEDFSEGFSFACDGKACGFLNAKGTFLSDPMFMGGTSFRGGLATVVLAMGMSRKRVAFLRKDGIRLPDEYEDAGRHAEGLAPVRVGGRWGYVDATGKPVVANRFAAAGEFSEGLGAVELADSGRCGYADRAGQLAVPARFRSCGPFREGLARVDLAEADTDADHVAFIDRTGAVVIDGRALDPPIHAAADFDHGLAAVGVGGPPEDASAGAVRVGYVDRRGRWAWRPTY